MSFPGFQYRYKREKCGYRSDLENDGCWYECFLAIQHSVDTVSGGEPAAQHWTGYHGQQNLEEYYVTPELSTFILREQIFAPGRNRNGPGADGCNPENTSDDQCDERA